MGLRLGAGPAHCVGCRAIVKVYACESFLAMNSPCPKCGAETSQSSGVVCPACGHILQPGVDDGAHASQSQSKKRFFRLALAFVIPFLAIAGCVGVSSRNPALGALCGGVVGGLFVVAFAVASTRLSNPLGQAFGALLLFLGFAAVLFVIALFGCRLIAG